MHKHSLVKAENENVSVCSLDLKMFVVILLCESYVFVQNFFGKQDPDLVIYKHLEKVCHEIFVLSGVGEPV